MLKIRFLKTGKKNQPFFRIVVTEKENPPKGGRFVEIVGFFNPFTKEKNLKKERIKYWISVGAQPSDRVHNMLIEEGIIKGKKVPVHSKKQKKKEGEEEKKEDTPKPEVKQEVKEVKLEEKKKEVPKEEVKKEEKIEGGEEKKEEPKKEEETK